MAQYDIGFISAPAFVGIITNKLQLITLTSPIYLLPKAFPVNRLPYL